MTDAPPAAGRPRARRGRLALVLLIIAVVGVSIPAGLLIVRRITDGELVAAIRRAVDDRVAPDDFEAHVGRPADVWLNEDDETRSRFSILGAIEYEDALPDAVRKALLRTTADDATPPRGDGMRVAYWILDAEGNAAGLPLVGVIWDEDGDAELFRGKIYPP